MKLTQQEFKKKFLAEMKEFEGKGMDEKELKRLTQETCKKMDFTKEHTQKIGPKKLALMLVIMHAKRLAKNGVKK